MSQLLRHVAVYRQVGIQSCQLRAPTALYSARAARTSPARFYSTILTMAPPNQDSTATGSSSRGDGSSRKRRYPFPRGQNQNRNRRGPPTAHPSASASAPFTTSSFSSSPASGVAVAEAQPIAHAQQQPSATTATGAQSFASLAAFEVNPVLLDTIHNDLRLTTMTAVQAETLPSTLAGNDVLAQAKTGTGKTIAFLLPAINKLVSSPSAARGPPRHRPISLLVISPTRELATQIADEAQALLKRFPHFKVQSAVGGTNAKSGLNRVLNECDILVATPGRLLDFLGQEDGALRHKLQGVKTLVLDEADRLMDMGFLPDIEKVVRYLPEKVAANRQGMLFSATINPRVQQFARLVCSDSYKFICTIPKGTPQTHEHVPQGLIHVPTFSGLTTAVLGALRHEMNNIGKDKFKAIVFAPTAAQTDLYADVLAAFTDLPPVLKVHSRMTQSKRTKNTDQYRQSTSAVLVATDVVARGLDFPGVTAVFQVGMPSDKEAYIHRLGRTARAGAEGRGTLILAEPEIPFAKKNLSMVKFHDHEADLSAHGDVMRIMEKLDEDMKGKVYRAWLGYYKAQLKTMGWTPEVLVKQANILARDGLSCVDIPGVEKKTVGKMGLKGVPGLNITPSMGR